MTKKTNKYCNGTINGWRYSCLRSWCSPNIKSSVELLICGLGPTGTGTDQSKAKRLFMGRGNGKLMEREASRSFCEWGPPVLGSSVDGFGIWYGCGFGWQLMSPNLIDTTRPLVSGVGQHPPLNAPPSCSVKSRLATWRRDLGVFYRLGSIWCRFSRDF